MIDVPNTRDQILSDKRQDPNAFCDLKKIVRVVSEIYKKALEDQILNGVAFIQVVRKRVSFQDRKNENNPKFLSIEI